MNTVSVNAKELMTAMRPICAHIRKTTTAKERETWSKCKPFDTSCKPRCTCSLVGLIRMVTFDDGSLAIGHLFTDQYTTIGACNGPIDVLLWLHDAYAAATLLIPKKYVDITQTDKQVTFTQMSHNDGPLKLPNEIRYDTMSFNPVPGFATTGPVAVQHIKTISNWPEVKEGNTA